MKFRTVLLAACIGIAACQPESPNEVGTDQNEPVTGAAVSAAPVGVAVPPVYVAPPHGFKTPLPAGVSITLPYKARMDVSVPNKDGSQGRRTEFAFLEGDAKQAMQGFSDALGTAGFTTTEGPIDESGVIKQVFNKPGYGLVFARAENADTETLKDPEAKGFLVAAWPSDERAVADGAN